MELRRLGFTFFLLAPAAGATDRFATDVRPIVERYCFECHDGASAKGEIDLERFASESAVRAEAGLWVEVERRIQRSEMPPLSHPQPSGAERVAVTEWIDHTLRGDAATSPGRTPPRRISRSEWRNTVRDVFAIHEDFTRDFPQDGSGGAGFDNAADTLFASPLLLERWFEAAARVAETTAESVILEAAGPDCGFDRAAAARAIANLGQLCYRRPLSSDELARLLDQRDRAAATGAGFVDSIRPAIRTMLVSPNFLYRIERDRPGVEEWVIDDLELATRLASFLWSSSPDQRLLDLAIAGELSDGAVLRAETERLLDDPRSLALADDFAAQWLGIRRLESAAEPDRGRFPAYTDSLRTAMIAEARLFFDAVVREGRPLLELVDSSFTFVNEELAAHYGIAGVRGEAMRRIILTNPQRGGVATMGASLTLTSYPLRTSPVNRGRFVLDELLGDPPPPPPPSVAFLPADENPGDGLSTRQRLERHRADPSCASCHARMDPLGFALEGYDAIGRVREALDGAAIDVSAQLADGRRFEGAVGLRHWLTKTRNEDFVRAFVERLLGFALARAIEPSDAAAVDAIVERARSGEASVREVVHAIVESRSFRWRAARRGDRG